MSGRCLAVVCMLMQGCNFAVPDVATVPAAPTFQADVGPILQDHCVLCHGERPARGAPTHFRLDQAANSPGPPRVLGARNMANSLRDQVVRDLMPPAARWGDGLGPNAKATLIRWVDQGAPP